MTRGEIWDAGKYKDKDGDIIEKFLDGRSRVRFKKVLAADRSRHRGSVKFVDHLTGVSRAGLGAGGE
jgi:hypothetical protein